MLRKLFFYSVLMLMSSGAMAVTYYVAPSPEGNDSNNGTSESTPFANLQSALKVVKAGDMIWIKGGVYPQSAKIGITEAMSGTDGNMIKIWTKPGERAIFDFTGSSDVGFEVRASWVHYRGLTIRKAGDRGWKMKGSHNILENCEFCFNRDSGIQIANDDNPDNAAYNLILNCDAHHNFDDDTGGSNADGFACKLGPGKGNIFKGCRAWENSDDGWDFYEAKFQIVIDSCISWHNGDAKSYGFTGTWKGNGQGFKVGGGDNVNPCIVTRSITFDANYGPANSNQKGIDQNHNFGSCIIRNNIAFDNEINISFYENPTDGGKHEFSNNVAFGAKKYNLWFYNAKGMPKGANNNGTGHLQQNNNWNINGGDTINCRNYYISLDTTLARLPRQLNGALQVTDFCKLKFDAPFIDAGVNVGMPYLGTAPDLGPFEYNPANVIDALVYPSSKQFKCFPTVCKNETTLSFDLEQATDVKITGFDLVGRKQIEIPTMDYEAGTHTYQLNLSSAHEGYILLIVEFTNSENKEVKETFRLVKE